jgi:hypothetical protein
MLQRFGLEIGHQAILRWVGDLQDVFLSILSLEMEVLIPFARQRRGNGNKAEMLLGQSMRLLDRDRGNFARQDISDTVHLSQQVRYHRLQLTMYSKRTVPSD